jgi:hypothetical protein
MSGNGKGNGTGKKTWNLAKEGLLWRRVLDYASKEFQEEAEQFVAQLQESVQPADALQGLLLDRMAASYLRKRLMLEAESATRAHIRFQRTKEASGSNETKRVRVIAESMALQSNVSANAMRYEALLDQGFHRDLILLQKLKETAPVPNTKRKLPQKADDKLIEGGGADLTQTA